VAPSDRFNFLAIFPAGAFLRAIDFSSRTSTDVQARLVFPFFIRAFIRAFLKELHLFLAGAPFKIKACFVLIDLDCAHSCNAAAVARKPHVGEALCEQDRLRFARLHSPIATGTRHDGQLLQEFEHRGP
jgi:hypothetical protein